VPTLACRLVEMEYRQSKRSSMADRGTHRPLRPGDLFYHHRVLERFPAWLAPNYRRQVVPSRSRLPPSSRFFDFAIFPGRQEDPYDLESRRGFHPDEGRSGNILQA
jgi:hypothetical protein